MMDVLDLLISPAHAQAAAPAASGGLFGGGLGLLFPLILIGVEIADGIRVRVQKSAIANVLPKGTLKSA